MKKLWVSVKRGFIRDPKHRNQVGEAVWLYLYMLDAADWDTGVLSSWQDGGVADELGLPIWKVREQRRLLSRLGYITVAKGQRGQAIYVHNWTDPREYTGNVYNVRGENDIPDAESEGQSEGQSEETPLEISGPTFNQIPNTKEKAVSLKKVKLPGIAQSIYAGRPTTSEDMAASRGADPATTAFEEALGVNPWPWDGPKLAPLARFLRKEYAANPSAFGRLSAWLQGDGKFITSPPKIRTQPEVFMDTVWPLYVTWNKPQKSNYEVLM